MAKAYYIPLALHNVGSPVGTMASAHVAAASSNFIALEFHARGIDWWDDLIGESIIDEGRIHVPDDPGLGIEVDLDVVQEHMAEDDTLFDES